MLTDVGDKVFDPFAGSCVVGEVAERLSRKWICAEMVEDYLTGALGRFRGHSTEPKKPATNAEEGYYRVPHPGLLWNGHNLDPLAIDGGKKRPKIGKRTTTILTAGEDYDQTTYSLVAHSRDD
jgi:DNA methylase